MTSTETIPIDRPSRVVLLVLAWLVCASSVLSSATANQGDTPMKLTSPAFAHGSEIPKTFTCEGGDTAPPLRIEKVPAGTKSLALIVDDPDAPDPRAPQRTWVHWVLFNLPPNLTSLPEGGRPLPGETQEGLNDWNRLGYGGPCPPIGRHRYFFKLYALDTMLKLAKPSKKQLEAAIAGHTLAHAELMGTYQKHAGH